MKTVGMITIGQPPRDDLMPRFRSLLGPRFRLAEAGAPDGPGAVEAQAVAPRPGQYPLITRLRGGTRGGHR